MASSALTHEKMESNVITAPAMKTAELWVETHHRLDSIEEADWQFLFSDHPDTFEMISLQQRCGMDGFGFHSVVVRDPEGPLLFVPLFDVQLELKMLVKESLRWIAGGLAAVAPSILAPRLLGVGFVEGEWGAVGVRPGLSPERLASAWELAWPAMGRLQREIGATLTVLFDFPQRVARFLPNEKIGRFARIDTYPNAFLELRFDSVDAYLAGLSRATRKNIRKKLRQAERIGNENPGRALRFHRATDPEPYLDAIYALYLATVRRVDRSLGVHRRSYFESFTREVSGSHYTLYFVGNKLAAFNLVIERGETFIDKYFCMDEAAGRQYSLYFVSWMENIRHCIANRLIHYHAGTAAEETKARLGARFQPALTVFRHRNALVHGILSWLRPLLSYRTDPNLCVDPFDEPALSGRGGMTHTTESAA